MCYKLVNLKLWVQTFLQSLFRIPVCGSHLHILWFSNPGWDLQIRFFKDIIYLYLDRKWRYDSTPGTML